MKSMDLMLVKIQALTLLDPFQKGIELTLARFQQSARR
jgi:hypothetical protein